MRGRSVTDDSALPYLNAEVLWRECLQIVNQSFAELRRSLSYPFPLTKAVICRVNQRESVIYFSASHRSVRALASPRSFASAILQHYGGSGMMVAVWCQLSSEEFVDLVQCVQESGIALFRCHEQHAIFQF
jgi:hypothetical protein